MTGQLFDRCRVVYVQLVQPLNDGLVALIGRALREDTAHSVAHIARLGRRPQDFPHNGGQDIVQRPGRLLDCQIQGRRRRNHLVRE